jgi:carotenoid 1,2-hydratase
VGSVFSPSYYRARRSSLSPDPLRHCGINIALYGARDRRWVFTEPPRHAVVRGSDRLVLGGTQLLWIGDDLEVRFDERTAVFGRRVCGSVRLRAQPRFAQPMALGPDRSHGWWPIAPVSHVAVDLQQPRLKFSGSGYLDSNFGTAPLEHDFGGWTWSRASVDGRTTVLFDLTMPDGKMHERGWRFDRKGTMEAVSEPMLDRSLPATRWRLARAMRSALGNSARVLQTLEDTPFYARSLVELGELGEEGTPVCAIHESLDLRRFCNPWVQRMLPFRIRRGWRA